MKIIFLFLSLVLPSLYLQASGSFSYQSRLITEPTRVTTRDYMDSLRNLKYKLPIIGPIARAHKLKKITKRFWRTSEAQNMMVEFTFYAQENNLAELAESDFDDFYAKVLDFLRQYLGGDVVDFMVTLIGIDEFKEHALGLLENVKAIANASGCAGGALGASEDLSWIAAFGATYYYVRVPYLPGKAADVASKVVGVVVKKSNVHVKVCNIIHR